MSTWCASRRGLPRCWPTRACTCTSTTARFDLIVQNTTFHWRAYSNNLLSREYLELARAHLAPGGIMAWNGTYSADTVRTAEAVFAHVERRHGFVYGSDRPFATPRADAAAVLRALALDGQPVFDETSFAPGGLAATLATQPFVPAAQRHAGLNFRPGVITDGNLLAEFAHGSAFLHDALPGLTRALDDWRER
jgi:hypothetical protein